MQTLETLTRKDSCAIAALVEQSRAIGIVARGNTAGWEERSNIVGNVAKILGVSTHAGGTSESGWNDAVRWLDLNHPGWRGYPVHYPNGRVG